MRTITRPLTSTLAALLLCAGCGAAESATVIDGAPLDDPSDATTTAPPTTGPETTEPKLERQVLTPTIQVAHATDDPEWETEVHLDEAARARLVERFTATVAAFDVAIEERHGLGSPIDTDAQVIESIDLAESLIVTTGYYCLSGDPLVDAGPDSLVVRIDDGVLCDGPQPISSVFVVPRTLVGESFTVTVDSALDLVECPTIVVEDGVVTDRRAG